MTVYQVTSDVDAFRSLLPSSDAVASSRLLALDGTPRLNTWPGVLEVIVDNDAAPEPDIFDLGVNLLLHGKSWPLLRPLLQSFCEFLPAKWDGKIGHLVNVVGFCACLDPERTTWIYGKESGKRIRIERYAFILSKIPSTLIFKIEERRFEIFCTDALVRFVEEHRLTGLDFAAVYSTSARANDHGCHDSCSEEHGSPHPRPWIILNVGQNG